MPRALNELQKKFGSCALVTGASDGIGHAFAQQLAAQGFNLALVARREAVLSELAHELSQAHRIEVRPLAADLSDPRATDHVLNASQAMDIGLFVAAAGFGTSGPFIDNEVADELNMIDVNCRALAQMTHHFAKGMAQRKRGGIILMSSLVAFQGVPRAANYSATKAYVQSLAEGLSIELRPHGVSVLASAPGPVKSGFGARANMTMGASQTPDEVARVSLKALGRRTTVRPGFLAKTLELALKPLPRISRVRMMARVMGDMTKR
jgi:uncharacterized protein